MEAVIAGLVEKSMIGGAFLYMLHFFLTKYATSLEKVTDTLATVVSTLADISYTMKEMDKRIQRLEDK